jgi:hypothetical protein
MEQIRLADLHLADKFVAANRELETLTTIVRPGFAGA